MKFKFKIQKYQTDAVEAMADVFAGQPNRTAKYTRDLGRRVRGAGLGKCSLDIEMETRALRVSNCKFHAKFSGIV